MTHCRSDSTARARCRLSPIPPLLPDQQCRPRRAIYAKQLRTLARRIRMAFPTNWQTFEPDSFVASVRRPGAVDKKYLPQLAKSGVPQMWVQSGSVKNPVCTITGRKFCPVTSLTSPTHGTKAGLTALASSTLRLEQQTACPDSRGAVSRFSPENSRLCKASPMAGRILIYCAGGSAIAKRSTNHWNGKSSKASLYARSCATKCQSS